MRFLMTFALAVTSVAIQAKPQIDCSAPLPARFRASLNPGMPSVIPVSVLAPADLTESLLIRVFDEANAIWGPTGVALQWHRSTSKDTAVPSAVTVEIDDTRTDPAGHRGALGWTRFTVDGPAPLIGLSRANAEALIRGTPSVTDKTIATNEMLIGRALGRALSHELGHYLLKSKSHTPRGLMRASWHSDELLAVDRRGFELTREERIAAERRSKD